MEEEERVGGVELRGKQLLSKSTTINNNRLKKEPRMTEFDHSHGASDPPGSVGRGRLLCKNMKQIHLTNRTLITTHERMQKCSHKKLLRYNRKASLY